MAWFVCAFLSASTASARQDIVPGSRYTSARGAALGDAFLPLGDDGAAGLFYNPAILGRLKSNLHFEGMNLQFYGNYYYLDQYSLKNGIDFYKIGSLSGYLHRLQLNKGQYAGVGASIFPSFYSRGFSFGVLGQTQVGAVVNSDGSITYRSLYQLIPTLGVGLRLAGGVVRVGYSLQWVQQASGMLTVPDTTTPLGYNEKLAQGSAISHNLGFALTFPWQYLPSVNIVARNVLGARFREFVLTDLGKNTVGTPPDEPMTIDASISSLVKIGPGINFNFVLQGRDLTNTSQLSVFARLAAGAEISVKDSFFIRGGWGSGYPSAGFGLRREKGDISFAWYSEELGPSYQSLRDIRYLFHYQVRAF